MKNKSIHIGILGGMGPQASALLHSLIIEACTKQLDIKECHEFPLITHISIPARDFISDPDLRSQNTDLIQKAVRTLTAIPLDIAVIACNTAHLLIDEVPALKRLPLISLPKSVIDEAKNGGIHKLGLIASPTTIKMKLYHNIAKQHGIELVVPSARDLTKAEAIIRATIAGRSSTKEIASLKSIIDELKRNGAEKVALGCTELSVVMHGQPKTNLIDSLSATTNAVISQIKRLQGEPSHV